MKIVTSIGLAASLAFSLSTAAHATAILAPGSTATDPLGIDNLAVDGTIYNVTFSLTTFNSFAAGSTLSVDAMNALVSALNTLSVTELNNFVDPRPFAFDYIVDVDTSSSSTSDILFDSGTGWIGVAGSTGVPPLGYTASTRLEFPDIYVEAADFTAVGAVGVPEPLTLSLFGAGLIGAAAMRRRKAKA